MAVVRGANAQEQSTPSSSPRNTQRQRDKQRLFWTIQILCILFNPNELDKAVASAKIF